MSQSTAVELLYQFYEAQKSGKKLVFTAKELKNPEICPHFNKVIISETLNICHDCGKITKN